MKRIVVLLLVFAAIVSFTACQTQALQENPETKTAQFGAKKDTSDQLYIAVMYHGNAEYFYDHKQGLIKAGEDYGVNVEYTGPPDNDINAYIEAFNQSIAKKPNGIMCIGIEELIPSIQKAIRAGIPVVTIEGDLPPDRIEESGRLAYVGTDNLAAGRVGGKYLAEAIGGKGKVAILSDTPAWSLKERVEGYKQAFEGYPEIELVDEIYDTDVDPIKAAEGAAAILQKYPDLAAFACVEAAGGSGAATAVKEAGLAGKVKIISMDRGKDVCKYIEDGVITASVAQQTALIEYYALGILYNINNSRNMEITTDDRAAGVKGVPANIDTGVVIVTKQNAKYFMR